MSFYWAANLDGITNRRGISSSIVRRKLYNSDAVIIEYCGDKQDENVLTFEAKRLVVMTLHSARMIHSSLPASRVHNSIQTVTQSTNKLAESLAHHYDMRLLRR